MQLYASRTGYGHHKLRFKQSPIKLNTSFKCLLPKDVLGYFLVTSGFSPFFQAGNIEQ